MLTLRRSIVTVPVVLLIAACSPQETVLSVEDFQKPENAAALQKTLGSCNLVMASDSRAAVCTAARQAKFALDAKEIGRIRREQIAKRNGQPPAAEEGVTIVEKSLPDTMAKQAQDAPVRPGEAYRAELEPSR